MGVGARADPWPVRLARGLVLRRALLLAGAVAGGLASQRLVTTHLVPRVPALRVLELVSWVPGAFVGGFPVELLFVVVFEPSIEVSFDGEHVTLECESREWAEAVAALNPESDAPPVA